jgi:tRNA(His) guanylyltransferase
MKFNELDAKMRVFETAHDHCVLPEMFMIARLDGRSFTKLTKKTLNFEKPFDIRFRDIMVNITKHLMTSFNFAFGYTQSDEISLLFKKDEALFDRKLRKLNSVLAGEASAKASLELGCMAVFDCRISQLPTLNLIDDYFSWRMEDAHRNALNSHCYWLLRSEGLSPSKASSQLEKAKVSEKNELLFQRGLNFNEFPAWQKRGTALYWKSYEKDGLNPKTGETTKCKRREVNIDYEIPTNKESLKLYIGHKTLNALG